MNSNFIDYVKVYCQAGDGGDGAVAWRREKYVDRGGPDGGDGGRGGNIYVIANPQRWTLLHLKYTKFVKAPHGQPGKNKRKTGKSGKDVFLEVPLGTVVKDAESGQILGELLYPQQKLLVAKGGRGGRGNWHFRSPTNQAPDFAEKGEKGEKRTIILELKLLADVGLVGFPNAGKSTLLSRLTRARPKIAPYPFTTLTPNLGIVELSDYRSFVMADIPGIIEGAHLGKGLGLRFLRHIERNAVLLFLIPIDTPDIQKTYQVLLNELQAYEPSLLQKPRMLAITKSDLADEDYKKRLRPFLPSDIPHLFISSITGENLETLKEQLWQMVQKQKQRMPLYK